MADTTTNNISQYISEKCIKIAAMAKSTNISEGILRRSLSTKKRDLRADELLQVCTFLEKNPFDFFPGGKAG